MSAAEVQVKAQRDFDAWYKSANMFFGTFQSEFENGARDSDRYKIAAFHLHQAAESYYGNN